MNGSAHMEIAQHGGGLNHLDQQALEVQPLRLQAVGLLMCLARLRRRLQQQLRVSVCVFVCSPLTPKIQP